jgi:hypothetical protein
MQRRRTVLDQVRGHRFVGQQHELLDDPVRHVALAGHDRLNLAELRQDDLGLGRSKSIEPRL